MKNAKLQTTLENLTDLEVKALKSAWQSSRSNGHDFGFTDDIKVGGSKQADGALVSSLIKKGILWRDDEFGQFEFGDHEAKFEHASQIRAFLADKGMADDLRPDAGY
jgi:hypothetical protein